MSNFGTGMGPILLNNVTCNQSHLELFQCIHPLDIGTHDCDQENAAGVTCLNITAVTITTSTDIPSSIFISIYTDSGLDITSLISTR